MYDASLNNHTNNAMNIENSECPGVKLIHCFSVDDVRGNFTKIFSEPDFMDSGTIVSIKESYYSISNKNVIRGMHFQLPPYSHSKLVHVLQGEVEDVIIDLRKDSLYYKQVFHFRLSATTPCAIFIPEGFAHGFKSLADNTIMLYQVSSAYNPNYDSGVLYNSIPYDWGIKAPIVSLRDLSFVELENFESPF